MTKFRTRLLTVFAAVTLLCTLCFTATIGANYATADDALVKNVATDLFDVSDGKTVLTPASVLGSYKGVKITTPAESKNSRYWIVGIKGTFHGDSRIEYVFPQTSDKEGTSFAFLDADGNRAITAFVAPNPGKPHAETGKYSDAAYNAASYGGLYTATDYASHKSGKYKVYTVKANGSKVTTEFDQNFSNGVSNQGNLKALVQSVGDDGVNTCQNGFLPKYNGGKFAIELKFGTTAASIYMDGENGNSVEVASLSYKDYPEVAKLKSGYTVKIGDGAAYYAASNADWALFHNWVSAIPAIISINGVALDKTTVNVSETFADIVYAGRESEVDGKYVISKLEGAPLESFSFSSYLGIKSGKYGELRFDAYKNGVIEVKNAAVYTKKASGDYKLTVSYGDIDKEYTLIIGNEFSEIFDLGSDGKITLTPAAKIGNYTGALISSTARHWTYGIKGTFTGDSKFEFAFDKPTSKESVSFAYYDKSGKRVLTAFIMPPEGDATGNYFGGLYLESDYDNPKKVSYTYETEYAKEMAEKLNWGNPVELYAHTVKTVTPDGVKKEVEFFKYDGNPSFYAGLTDGAHRKRIQNAAGTGFMPAVNGKFAIELKFGATALSVLMNDADGNALEVASLNYQDYPEISNMKNGYTVKIGEGAAEGRGYGLICNEHSSVVSLLSINGVALDDVLPAVTYEDCEIYYDGETLVDGKNVIEIERTDELSSFNVVAKYSFGGLILRSVNKMMTADETFADKVDGEYDFTFVYGGNSNGVSKKYKVIIKNPVPQVTLNNQISGLQTISKDKNQTLQASIEDVVAESKVDGKLTNVKITVNAPNSSEYVDYENFQLGDFGKYIIRYTATNSFNEVSYVEREVRYAPSQPQVELSGEVVTNGYENKKITLPTANAGATVTVTFNGEPVSVKDYAFTPTNSGVYEVTYAYTDAYGITANKEFTINVIKDEEAPVITVATAPSDLNAGETIIAPAATAVDNADGEVQVNVEISLNGKKVGDTQVVANEKGVYRIEYTATDSSGNTSREFVEIFVGSKTTQEMFKKGGCSSSVDGAWYVAVIAIIAATLTLAVKRRKVK